MEVNKVFYLQNNEMYIDIENLYGIEDLNDGFTVLKTFNILGKYNFFEEGYYDVLRIKVGDVVGEYVVLDKEVFNLENTFKISLKLIPKLKKKHFVANRNISVFYKIDSLLKEDFTIEEDGYEAEEHAFIEWSYFENFVASFPNTGQLTKYSHYKIDESIGNYFQLKENYTEKYESYMIKKTNKFKKSKPVVFSEKIDESIINIETKKYKCAVEKLNELLKSNTNEHQWQKEILNLLVLVYPQYKYAIDEVKLNNNKRVDFILVDLFNNIDVIEIKHHNMPILDKSRYRDNYISSRELNGTVVQMEYYLYELSQSVSENITSINRKFKEKGIEVEVKINNPKGIIIMGRTNEFNDGQLKSYRIIKNQYSNIVNIISYDELIEALSNLVLRFETNGLTRYVE